MRALYAIQQHVALCGIECKTLLVIAGLFVTGLAAAQLRAEPLPYDEAFYAEANAPLAPPAPAATERVAPVALVEPVALMEEEMPAAQDSVRKTDSAREVEAGPHEPASPGHENAAARMNLNVASARLLTQLPGIGPKKAAAVVAYRDEHGAFSSVEHLQRVRGIGPKTVEKLAPLLFVEPPMEGGVQIAAN